MNVNVVIYSSHHTEQLEAKSLTDALKMFLNFPFWVDISTNADGFKKALAYDSQNKEIGVAYPSEQDK